MKKYLILFILSMAAFVSANADRYTGVMVDDGTQQTYYLFAEQPTVKYQELEGVMNACIYIKDVTDPVACVPLQNGTKLSVKYNAFVRVNLNTAGYATFSAKDASSIATDGVKAYKASIDGETIKLAILDGDIPAGTGVLLYGEDKPGAKVNLPVATSGIVADVSDNDFKPTTLTDGSLADASATENQNSWALGTDNRFVKFTGDTYVPNRAYLVHEHTANARAMHIVFADGEISELRNVVSEASARDGKYLENGNIVIIKNGKAYNVAGQALK